MVSVVSNNILEIEQHLLQGLSSDLRLAIWNVRSSLKSTPQDSGSDWFRLLFMFLNKNCISHSNWDNVVKWCQ
jgi:hypothetical protein